MTTAPNDKRYLPFGGSTAIRDGEVLDCLRNLSLDVVATLDNSKITDEFCKNYVSWISQSTLNSIKGLNLFSEVCYINGTTDGFNHFYAKNKDSRFRCIRGDYMYHHLSWRNNYPGWKFIDDDAIRPNDAVVISWPFSDTGCEHISTREILEECSRLEVPVLIDCIYYTVSSGITIDLNYDCITDVVFGLSKTFPVAHARIGIRLTKVDDDDPLLVVKKINYNNRISARIGLELLKNFTPDYIFNKYREHQKAMCSYLEVTASDTVLFGLGDNKWQIYNRGAKTNRLSFHNYLHLPLEEISHVSKTN